MSKPFQTRDQRLASLVYAQIEKRRNEWAQKEKDQLKKAYGSLAHRLPVMIRTAGLAQALAFVDARYRENEGKIPPRRQLLCDLQAVLRDAALLDTDKELVSQSRKAELDEYIRLTEMTLEALLWFKRFAESVLGVKPGEESEEDD